MAPRRDPKCYRIRLPHPEDCPEVRLFTERFECEEDDDGYPMLVLKHAGKYRNGDDVFKPALLPRGRLVGQVNVTTKELHEFIEIVKRDEIMGCSWWNTFEREDYALQRRNRATMQRLRQRERKGFPIPQPDIESPWGEAHWQTRDAPFIAFAHWKMTHHRPDHLSTLSVKIICEEREAVDGATVTLRVWVRRRTLQDPLVEMGRQSHLTLNDVARLAGVKRATVVKWTVKTPRSQTDSGSPWDALRGRAVRFSELKPQVRQALVSLPGGRKKWKPSDSWVASTGMDDRANDPRCVPRARVEEFLRRRGAEIPWEA